MSITLKSLTALDVSANAGDTPGSVVADPGGKRREPRSGARLRARNGRSATCRDETTIRAVAGDDIEINGAA